jgi:hypothetical protein
MLIRSTFIYDLAVVLPRIAVFVLTLVLARFTVLIQETAAMTGADCICLPLLRLAGAVGPTTGCLVSSLLLRPSPDPSRLMTSFRARTS